jgi:hypothetical protein
MREVILVEIVDKFRRQPDRRTFMVNGDGTTLFQKRKVIAENLPEGGTKVGRRRHQAESGQVLVAGGKSQAGCSPHAPAKQGNLCAELPATIFDHGGNLGQLPGQTGLGAKAEPQR